MTDKNYEQNIENRHQNIELVIPEKHQESLRRTLQIASLIRGEADAPEDSLDWHEPLGVSTIQSAELVPSAPGVYLLEGEVNTDRHKEIIGADFDIEAEILSGKVDSAHAVLPGVFNVYYSEDDSSDNAAFPVAIKGFYKRPFEERLDRIKTEVAISKLQETADELAYSPVALVIAPPEYVGKHTQHSEYDILLATRLDKSITTLDNAPWQLGFTPANLQLAGLAVDALGRFNTNVGLHADAKVKNVAQQAQGKTSMIDFETSKILDMTNPDNVAEVVHTDLHMLLDTMEDKGFFARESYRAPEVVSALAEQYLEHWSAFDSDVQDSAYEQATIIVERISEKYLPKYGKASAA